MSAVERAASDSDEEIPDQHGRSTLRQHKNSLQEILAHGILFTWEMGVQSLLRQWYFVIVR